MRQEKTLENINKSAWVGIKNVLLGFIKKYPIPFMLALLILVVAFIANNFFTVDNMSNILRQNAVIGVLACGMTFVIIAGGIDLSVSSIISFLGAWVILNTNEYGFTPALITTLLLGLLLGSITGLIVAGINGRMGESFIVSFGMQTVVGAVALIYTSGFYSTEMGDPIFTAMGKGWTPVIIFVCVVIVGQIILSRTRFGRGVYFVGANPEIARLSGLNVFKYRLIVFAISGLLAGLAAVMLSTRVGTSRADAGLDYELNAIAACAVGGIVLGGGRGNMWNTLLGVVILGVLTNALNLLGLSVYFHYILKGMIIVASVSLDGLKKAKEAKK